ncbi:hypothetical protein NIES3275_51180 [Microchaete diplosiphon NIES-3275]|nr:hypothetical protein NIES3275_51180 [Microchaete diplosiphon NIES-3275]
MFATHQYILEGKALPCPYNLSHSFFKLVSPLIFQPTLLGFSICRSLFSNLYEFEVDTIAIIHAEQFARSPGLTRLDQRVWRDRTENQLAEPAFCSYPQRRLLKRSQGFFPLVL